jgi:hypothetical protein
LPPSYINDDISLLHLGGQVLHTDLYRRASNQTVRSGFSLAMKFAERSGPRCPFTCRLLNALRLHIEDNALTAALK